PWWSRLKSWLFPPESRSKKVTAVCIPPGACLRLVGVPPPLQQKLGVGPVEDVIWTELSASPYEYRDAIHFTNGRRVLLQDLHEGSTSKCSPWTQRNMNWRMGQRESGGRSVSKAKVRLCCCSASGMKDQDKPRISDCSVD